MNDEEKAGNLLQAAWRRNGLRLLLAVAGIASAAAAAWPLAGQETGAGSPAERLAKDLVALQDVWDWRIEEAGDRPIGVLLHAAKESSEPAAVTAALAGAFGLEPEAAAALLDASLAGWKLEQEFLAERWDPTPTAEVAERLAAAEKSYLAVLDAVPFDSPARPRLLLELAIHYDHWARPGDGYPEKLVALLVAASEASLDLFAALDDATGFASAGQVLPLYLERRPGHPVLLEQLASDSSDAVERAVLRLAALAEIEADEAPEWRAVVTVRAVEDLLLAGLDERAVAALDTVLFDTVPQEAEKRFLAGELSAAGTLRGLPFEVRTDTGPYPLVAALALTGREQEARALLAAIPPEPRAPAASSDAAADDAPQDEAWEERQSRRRDLGRRLLEALLRGPDGDPFVLFAEILGLGGPFEAMPTRGYWPRLAAELASREGYPSFERYFLSETHAGFERTRKSAATGGGTSDQLPLGLRALAAELSFEAGEMEASLEGRLAGLAEATAAHVPRPERIANGSGEASPLEGLDLDAFALEVFDAVPLSEEGRAAQGRPRRLALEEPPPGLALPERYRAVAVDEESGTLSVLALGPGLRGGSGDGYWLLRSADGGTSWAEEIFTGLVPFRPYAVLPGPGLHELGSRRLRLSVEVWSTYFNRGHFLTGRKWGHAVVELDVEGLRADRDADGLTDLVESSLGLDPRRNDTDGDGLEDAAEPLPGLAVGAHPASALTEALAAALDRLPAFSAWARLVARNEGSGDGEDGRLGPALFLVTRPELLASFEPWRRVVVLSEGDRERLGETVWETFDPLVVRLFALDRTASRALILWQGAGSAGRLELKNEGGSWLTRRGHRSGGCHLESFEEEHAGGG